MLVLAVRVSNTVCSFLLFLYLQEIPKKLKLVPGKYLKFGAAISPVLPSIRLVQKRLLVTWFLSCSFRLFATHCISSIRQIIKSVCMCIYVSQWVDHTKRVERSAGRNLTYTKLAMNVLSQEMWLPIVLGGNPRYVRQIRCGMNYQHLLLLKNSFNVKYI